MTVKLQDLDREGLIEHQLAGYRKLPLDLSRLMPHVFRELATGQPVDPEHLAALTGLPLDRTLAALKDQQFDPTGKRLVAMGLTHTETPHRFEMNDRTMWVWCAPDALMFPSIIGKEARVHSQCAGSGDPIRVHLTPHGIASVDPPSAVVSNVSAHRIVTHGKEGTCDVSNFYRDAEAASDWLDANPNGAVLPVLDVYELYREVERRYDAWLAEESG